ncbi:hypothetical protein B5X24_HaOG207348 [Helicoverpa armigera]|uniref:CRAL/TRIO N-terminal domain-containing protein n=1 Tax=Helicoverpa armigera TaxID=29058 RepID=A0A2W1BHW9_HELAM|nr:hypothetical protein B5X24_HaOG207348 [Helicoverpa armigera]
MPVRALTPVLAEKARAELNEDPARLEADLQHIKDWLAKQPHINARTDDQWLVVFLRGCKFSLERTKEKLDLYYSVRTTAPELFQMRHTDPLFDEILGLGAFIILPKPATPDGPLIAIVRLSSYDPNKYNIVDVMAATNALMRNLDEFYNYVPKEALPAEYGGNAGTIDEITAYWRNKVKEYGSWLEEDFKYGTDESKRPGKPKTAEDMFGVDGSFRKLDFD